MPRYNPLRLFVVVSELSKHCQTFVVICFYLSIDRDIPRKVPALGEKSCSENREIFPLLAMPTSIAPIFFRTHLPFTWLLRSNAHWFSGRLLTYSPCISNLLHRKKILFHIFIHTLYLHTLSFSPSPPPPPPLPRSVHLFVCLYLFSFNRVLLRQSNIYKY